MGYQMGCQKGLRSPAPEVIQKDNEPIQRPSQANHANGYEAIRSVISNLVSEHNTSVNIHLDSPTVPESINVSFNSPAIPETDSETIRHVVLTSSDQDQILGVTSHYNSVDIYVGNNSKAREDEDPADDKKEAFGAGHVSGPTLGVDRDRIGSKTHLNRSATGLSEEAPERLKRRRRIVVQLDATYRGWELGKRWLQHLQELKDQVQELNQKAEAICKELATFREWQ